MNLLWASFLRKAAGHSKQGSIRSMRGVEAAWVHSDFGINNGTYLTAPAASEEELRQRLEAAANDARPHGQPWAFYLYEPYVEGIAGDRVAALAASAAGLSPLMQVRVMTGDVQELRPPSRPLPELEFRRITSMDEARVAFDINLRSYEMPVELGESVLATNAYFSDPQSEYGFVAYAGGEPVSTASVLDLDGWLYVALVATDPDHRQRGYAEAVMRHALKFSASALGRTRTSLDASGMGAPLYEQMGYTHTGETWTMYSV